MRLPKNAGASIAGIIRESNVNHLTGQPVRTFQEVRDNIAFFLSLYFEGEDPTFSRAQFLASATVRPEGYRDAQPEGVMLTDGQLAALLNALQGVPSSMPSDTDLSGAVRALRAASGARKARKYTPAAERPSTACDGF